MKADLSAFISPNLFIILPAIMVNHHSAGESQTPQAPLLTIYLLYLPTAVTFPSCPPFNKRYPRKISAQHADLHIFSALDRFAHASMRRFYGAFFMTRI